jgi:uncharacterized membrane protein YdjX (TVP38/TMEM64 family)
MLTLSDNVTPSQEGDRSQARTIWTIAIILVLTILPFAIFGPQLESWTMEFLESDRLQEHRIVGGLVIIGLLIADVFLPVPSSFVGTWSGAWFGALLGAIVNWLGLTGSALLGYFAAAWLSRSGAGDSQERQRGPWFVAFLRGLPVLAEGSILYAGARHWPLRRLVVPLSIANLVLAAGYACLGAYARDQEWLAEALAISIAIPAIPLAMVVWHDRQNRKRRHCQ